MVKRSYSEVKHIFEQKGCVLLTSIHEYAEMKEVSRNKFKFVAKCGHNNEVMLTNFICKGSGVLCKNCVQRNVSNRIKALYEGYNGTYGSCLESKAFNSALSFDFDIMKSNEGCKADFLLKPLCIKDDKWLMVQLKSTQNVCHNIYTFSIKERCYDNCIVICVCTMSKEIWMFDWTEVLGKKKINIGLSSMSTFYNNKQDSIQTLIENLHRAYALYPKYRNTYAMIPTSYYQRREQMFRKHRESNISCLKYEYPVVDGLKYDFIINGFKVQEKVSGMKRTNKHEKTIQML